MKKVDLYKTLHLAKKVDLYKMKKVDLYKTLDLRCVLYKKYGRT